MARRVRSRWIGQIQVTMARPVLALPSSAAPPGPSWRGVPGPTGSAGNSRRHARDALAAATIMLVVTCPACRSRWRWWSVDATVRQRPATPPLHNVGSLPQPPACRRDLIAGLGSPHGRLPPAQGVHQAGHHVQGRAARAGPRRRCLTSHSITLSVRGHHAWQPGQAEITAGGGAGRRPAQRRGRADQSIAPSAPPGTAAPLPRGGQSPRQQLQ